jgi:hypothetical protein
MNKKTLTWLLKFVGDAPRLAQVRFRPGEAVVTDGHRLVRLNWVPFGDDPSVRVPAETLRQAARVMPARGTITVTASAVLVDSGSGRPLEIPFREPDETFPPVEQVIPVTITVAALGRLNGRYLAEACGMSEITGAGVDIVTTGKTLLDAVNVTSSGRGYDALCVIMPVRR